ncbi:MAG TPA: hypothetical protein VEV17_03530 [Bryobacteraceae bacterium]|nr:hypothetical protein [Bryobacteraceae bacterium]
MRLRFYVLLGLALVFALALAAGVLRPRHTATQRTSSGCCSAARDLPATQLGSLILSGGAINVILSSDGVTAYACGPTQISVIDISTPGAPRLVSTFGSLDLGGNAISGCFQVGQSLVVPVNVQSAFVYDISNSRNLRSQSQFTPAFPFNGYVSFLGNVGWFTTDWFRYSQSNNLIFEQHGDFAAVDFTDPTHPAAVGNLSPDSSQPDASSNLSPRFSSLTIGGDTAYIFSTTATGGDTNGGQGAMQIINISNPAAPVAQGQILIPQATTMTGGAVQDNILLATGNTKSWRNPGTNPRNSQLNFQFTGVLTLSAMDVTDPHNPVLLSSRCSDVATWQANASVLVPLGNGFFALSAGPRRTTGSPSGPTRAAD